MWWWNPPKVLLPLLCLRPGVWGAAGVRVRGPKEEVQQAQCASGVIDTLNERSINMQLANQLQHTKQPLWYRSHSPPLCTKPTPQLLPSSCHRLCNRLE